MCKYVIQESTGKLWSVLVPGKCLGM
jgi:hypothetical protein